MTQNKVALFVDSSVWVHALRDVSPLHELARGCLLHLALQRITLCTSVQVVRELCALLLQSDPRASAVDAAKATHAAAAIGKSCNILSDTQRTLDECLRLVRGCELPPQALASANIVAVMRTNQIAQLLTATPQEYAPFAELIEVVPLETAVRQFSG